MGWKSKLEKARRRHRPSLKNWERDRLYETFPAFVREIESRPEESYKVFIPPGSNVRATAQHLPVILDAKSLSTAEFWSEYEAKCIPAVIKNIPQGYDGVHASAAAVDHGDSRFGDQNNQNTPWPALEKWLPSGLAQDDTLRNRLFKCGEDDYGKSIKVKLKHFLRYLEQNRDDSPLYIFDSAFDDDKYAKRLLTDYTVPAYFRDDLFRFISENRRPPYRWFLVGPERSGTTVHIDPLGTSAWNTLIHGKKRWVLFPPHVPKHIVKGKGLIGKEEDDEAIHYFMYILPRIKQKAAIATTNNSKQMDKDYANFCCYEFTQEPGETVYIPNGWWHAVLNLTHTVGVTQNYCSPRNFDESWKKTRSGRKRMAWKLLCQLDEHYPHLAARARELNQLDHFRMKYDPKEIQRREEAEHRRKLQRMV